MQITFYEKEIYTTWSPTNPLKYDIQVNYIRIFHPTIDTLSHHQKYQPLDWYLCEDPLSHTSAEPLNVAGYIKYRPIITTTLYDTNSNILDAEEQQCFPFLFNRIYSTVTDYVTEVWGTRWRSWLGDCARGAGNVGMTYSSKSVKRSWSRHCATSRKWVRFPKVSLEFFSVIILTVPLWLWGRISL
jgi:hypothetical protein